MALEFVTASKEGYETAQSSAGMPTAYPITLGCRFRQTTTGQGVGGTFFTLGEKTTGEARRIVLATSGANELIGFVKASNSQQFTTTLTSPTIAADTWYTACWCLISNTERRLYLDNSSQTAGGTGLSSAPLNEVKDYVAAGFLNFFGTGGDPGVAFFDGQLADAAAWDIELSADEINAYGAGASPLRLRKPVRYYPLLGDDVDNVPELMNGVGLTTKHGTPTRADHSRILRPSSRFLAIPPQAKLVPLGLPAENDSGFGVSPDRSHGLGLVTEIDDAPNIQPVRLVALGQAAASDTTFGLTHGKSLALGQALEADAALALQGVSPTFASSRHVGMLRDVGRLTN